MSTERDVQLPDDRVLRVHDSGDDGPALVWHHGTPQTGALLAPVLAAARARGMRLVSYARPSYRGSSPHAGRDVASAGGDVACVLDALGIDTAAHVGASGGGPHALACAAAMPDRTTAVVSIAGLAPFVDGFDWASGMASDAALRAAATGRDARAAVAEPDVDPFVAADWEALAGVWQSLGADAVAAGSDGPDGAIDDDVAYAHPWGFDLEAVTVPVLLVHGGLDRVVPTAHSRLLLDLLPDAELWLRPRESHVSVLSSVPLALDWIVSLP
ncbi:MAG: alpha/beta hydrolase [Brevundimonas sp.]